MTVRAATAAEIEAVSKRLSYVPSLNVRGLTNGSAMILYDQWTENSVCVHSYIPEPRFLTKTFLREMFRFPFSHVDWAIGVTPADNERALAFNKKLGFTEVYRLPDGWSKGVDQVFQTMHHSGCRYWSR